MASPPKQYELLVQDARQATRLRQLVAGLTIDENLIAAPDKAMAVFDAHAHAHAPALPLCRTMERTRNTILQQRAHLRTWLDRAATGDGNVGAGHIRWSKSAKRRSGKLVEFSVRYIGKAEDGRGHVILVETSGTPATGFVAANGHPLDPRTATAQGAHASGGARPGAT